MKHLWIINHYAHGPSDKGGLTRHDSLGRHLPAHGWHASIVAARTEHPSGRRRPSVSDVGAKAEGAPAFHWIDVPEYWGNGWDRILNMVLFGWRAQQSRMTTKLAPPDVILGSSPHPLAALAGLRLSRRLRVPFVYEVRDPWPEALIDMGRIGERGLTARLMRSLERKLYQRAERSITLWPNMGAYLEEHGIQASPPVWISNGVDPTVWQPLQAIPENQDFTLMYLGAHGGANGLDNVIHAMRLVEDLAPDRAIRLRLIGDGPRKPALQELASTLGCTKVFFEDPIEKHCVPQAAAEADAFVFNLIDAKMFRFGISPNKLYEYMAAQRPIIFCCEAFNDPVAEAGCGMSVPPGQPDKLAAAILELASRSRDERQKMAIAAHRYVTTHFTFEELAKKLANLLDECITQNDAD